MMPDSRQRRNECAVITMRAAIPGDDPMVEVAHLHLRLCDALEAAGFDVDTIHFELGLQAAMPVEADLA